MTLKLFKTRDEVPEAQRAGAIELKDGQFAIEEAPDPALGDAGARAIAAERTAREKAERERTEAQQELDRIRRENEARDKGVTEAQLQEIRDAEALARKPIVDENAVLKAENKKLKYTDRLKQMALGAGIMTDRIDDAMLVLEQRTQPGDAGGIVVLGKDGKATAETIENFLKVTFKTEKKFFYKGSGASGSGAEGSDGDDAPPPKREDQIAAKRAQVAGAL